jgi:hypothetical protein
VSGIPSAFLSHVAAGRMRLRIPSKKRDASYFSSLKERMSKCGGVERIETNPLTASMLIVHNGDARAICGFAADSGLFSVKELKTNPANAHQGVSELFEGMNKRIKGLTGNGMDIGSLSFLALAGVGIYQISRGNFSAPAWYTAFWYALNIFLKSKPDKSGE